MKKRSLLISTSKFLFAIMIFLLAACNSNTSNKNNDLQEDELFYYFENVEIQYETEEQRENILSALNDIIYLSVEELKNKRYKNYMGEMNKWNLETLINSHFIPDNKNKKLGDNFYDKLKRKEVQEQVEKIMTSLNKSR
jgi:hypothetical protein